MFTSGQEIEILLDTIPISVILQDYLENNLIINNSARKLLNRNNIELSLIQQKITSMRAGTHNLIFGKTVFSVNCSFISHSNRSGKICIFTDISEKTRLEEHEQIYKACLDSITDLNLFACDAEGTILLYNNSSARSDSVKNSNILGKNMYEVFGKDSDTAVRRALTTGEPVLDLESIYNVGNRRVRNLGSAYPIKSNGKIIGAFSINRPYEGVRNLLMRSIDLQKQLISISGNKSNGTSYDFSSIIGESEALLHAIEIAKRVAGSAASVLIYGETGTGKELFAQSIHNASPNAGEPFLAINCAAIPETLLESTLFGTVKGAFTGADSVAGLIEQAGEGSLFLDEINSMPLNLQSKLLRVLQERVFRRVGGNKDILVKCRFISSCNFSPLECVDNGTLRKDLYYRLAVVSIEVPALRNRRGDVRLLTRHFLEMYSRIYGVREIRVSPSLLVTLEQYSWPGNIRELKHIIEGSLLQLNPGEELDYKHLPDIFLKELQGGADRGITEPRSNNFLPSSGAPYNLEKYLGEIRREAILAALRQCSGNITHAAKMLGYNRSTLQYQIEKLQIDLTNLETL